MKDEFHLDTPGGITRMSFRLISSYYSKIIKYLEKEDKKSFQEYVKTIFEEYKHEYADGCLMGYVHELKGIVGIIEKEEKALQNYEKIKNSGCLQN